MAENDELTTRQGLRITDFVHSSSSLGCITKLVDSGTVESYRLYLARKTLVELLHDRGYAVPDSEFTRSLDEFRSEFGQKPDSLSLRIRTSLLTNPSSQILVIFGGTEEIKKGNIFTILNQIIGKERVRRVIVVLQSKMNHHARKIVKEYPIKIEVFQITDLMINVTKHVSAPKYEPLTPEEKQCLHQKYHFKDEQLPRMLGNDAVARYYGLMKGQVVRVSYCGGLANSLVTYRCVM